MTSLWLRWTARDFRSRWIQILATALILAGGIGAFFGVGGLREWREQSTFRSYEAMRAHDLRFDLAEAAYASQGQLARAAGSLPPGTLAAAEERLVAASQADASQSGDPVLVPAKLIGIPVRAGGQSVDRVGVISGDGLEQSADALSGDEGAAASAGVPSGPERSDAAPSAAEGAEGSAGAASGEEAGAVIDWNFARQYELPPTGEIRLAGVGSIPYVGQGVTPEHVVIVGEAGISGAESTLATIYLPLEAAQRAVGLPGKVNQLVVRTPPGADLDAVEAELTAALERELPGVGVSVTRGDEEAARRILLRDAKNDQQMFLAIAILLLVGAGIATFNLVSRVVEAQRREIGVGMALGVEPRMLAVRPLALGAQIALLGVVLGVPIGLALAAWIKDMLKDFYPLPLYATTFPAELFLIAAGLGLVVPVIAAALPVRRAVRVAPVEAIRTGHRAGKGGPQGLLRRLTVPGRALAQLPLRNLARAPRRTLLTVLGLGGVITAVVSVLGMVDAIDDTAERQREELLRTSPERISVELADPEPAEGPTISAVSALPGVGEVEPTLTVPARMSAGEDSIDAGLRFVAADSALWRPSVLDGEASADGILIARRAADDLGVGPGDEITLTHPRVTPRGIEIDETPVEVAGVHANPVRAIAYMDESAAAGLGLGGGYNGIAVNPAPGADVASIERALFGREGVASVRPEASEAEALENTVEAFSSAIQIVAALTLALALLVAFTSTSVALDERRREYATMFAFGLPVRSGLRVSVIESLVIGLLGTLVGLALGALMLSWIVGSLMSEVFPDLGAEVVFTGSTIAATLLVGILAVTLAPLMTARRMRAMDIPSTLRVME